MQIIIATSGAVIFHGHFQSVQSVDDKIQLGKVVETEKTMILFLGFVYAEFLLIKKQMK